VLITGIRRWVKGRIYGVFEGIMKRVETLETNHENPLRIAGTLAGILVREPQSTSL
jgi:hypothetical protein